MLRARVWSVLVALVAALLAPVLVATTAQAAPGDLGTVDQLWSPECALGGDVPDTCPDDPDPGFMAMLGGLAAGTVKAPTRTGSGTRCNGVGCLVLGTAAVVGVLWDAFTDGGAIDLQADLGRLFNPEATHFDLDGLHYYDYPNTSAYFAPANQVVNAPRDGSAWEFSYTGPAHPSCRYGCNVGATIGVDYRVNGGPLMHSNYSAAFQILSDGAVRPNITIQLLPIALRGTQGLLVERVHIFSPDGLNFGVYGGRAPGPGELDRTYLEKECQPAGGGPTYMVRAYSEPGSTVVVPPACDPGDSPVRLDTGIERENGTDEPHSTLDLTGTGADLSQYPACAGSACKYAVHVDGQKCEVGAAACKTWTSNPQAQCFYGPYQVDRSLCYWLERAYEWQTPLIPATGPNTDGNPATWEGPNPALDPATNPTASPSPTVTVQPSPNPTTSTAPGTGPTGNPTSNPTSSPTAPATGPGVGTLPPAQCVSQAGYALGAVHPEAVRLADTVGPMFGFEVIGGQRPDPIPDHPDGRALDFMTYDDVAMGDAAAAYMQNHATALGVNYIIWKQRIWSVARAQEGWRLMEDRGDPTQNHMDHIHVTVYTGTMGGDCPGVGGSDGSGGDECWPAGWGVFNPAEWVLRPTKCALQWAFVPRSGFMADQFGGVQDSVMGSSLGQWFMTMQAYGDVFSEPPPGGGGGGAPMQPFSVQTVDDFAGVQAVQSEQLVTAASLTSVGSNCRGPVIHVDDLGPLPVDIHAEPLNVCNGGHMATAANFTRLVTAVGLVVAGVFTSTRAILDGIGYEGTRGLGA